MEEAGSLEEETEVDAEVPVAAWIGDIVAIDRNCGEGEGIDGGNLRDEVGLGEPAR